MALNITNVRAAMAAQFDVAYGAELQIATAPDNLTPPCLLLGMPDVDYHHAFASGLDMMSFPVYVIHPRTHDQAAVDLLDRMVSGVGPESLIGILEADQRLGGACQTLVAQSAAHEIYPAATGDLPCYHFTIEVYG
jgi:hypothetical protein